MSSGALKVQYRFVIHVSSFVRWSQNADSCVNVSLFQLFFVCFLLLLKRLFKKKLGICRVSRIKRCNNEMFSFNSNNGFVYLWLS